MHFHKFTSQFYYIHQIALLSSRSNYFINDKFSRQSGLKIKATRSNIQVSLPIMANHYPRKNLLAASHEEKKEFMNSFDYILTDCDGTIWHLIDVIPGVGAAITTLEKNGKHLVYITNNSLRSNEEYIEKFKKSSIVAKIDNVLHPAISSILYLQQRNFKGLIYVIGSPAFRNRFKAAGFDTIDGPNEFVNENFGSLWKSIKDGKPVKAVVIDTDFNLTSAKLIRAQLYLNDPECLFIVGTTDNLLPITKQDKIIGPGPFYKIVEDAVGRKATIVGKPGDALKDIIMQKYKLCDTKRILFIGDMFEQDIAFGKAAGFQTMAVLTGGISKGDLDNHVIKAELPDYYLDSFADFTKVYEDIENNI